MNYIMLFVGERDLGINKARNDELHEVIEWQPSKSKNQPSIVSGETRGRF